MGSRVLSFDQNFSMQKDYIDSMVFYFDQNFINNPSHKILEIYNILVKIRFTTSKTKFDI